jgi:hypothetical protein
MLGDPYFSIPISTRCNVEFLSSRSREPIPLAHIFMKVIGKLEDLLNSSNKGGGVLDAC